MKRIRRISTLTAASAAMLAVWAVGVQASVIIGSPMSKRIIGASICPRACTLSQSALPGATVTSPVDGVIVRWQLLEGTVGKKYSLRVLDPQGPLSFFGSGTSAAMTPSAVGMESFPAALPIHAGQVIGLDLEPNAGVASMDAAGATSLFFQPPVVDGATSTAIEANTRELGFNAEIQAAPAITTLTPNFGPVGGGTSVRITGTDLEGATAVRFGDVPATSYQVTLGVRITAVAPPSVEPTSVPITVTTIAGSATAPEDYAYLADPGGDAGGGGGGNGGGGKEDGGDNGNGGRCVVPRLKGKRLAGSKRVLKRAGCRIGKVKKKIGAAASKGKVVRQSAKPGRVLPPAAKVGVTLGR